MIKNLMVFEKLFTDYEKTNNLPETDSNMQRKNF